MITIERERAERTVATALRAVRRVAQPGQEITITHWWGNEESVPQSITVREIA
jgi:hypothetical protein